MDDDDAYKKYQKHHKWFNKLYLAESLGYNCGPCGLAPDVSGWYMVRPIYNLYGMGAFAEKKWIEKGDFKNGPPGHFWCEWFEGHHWSVTYEFISATKPWWKAHSAYRAEKQGLKFTRWNRWIYLEDTPTVPRILNDLSNVPKINVEFIGDKTLEVHLRESPDPDYDILIPVWGDTELKEKPRGYSPNFGGYEYIEAFDDADGYLENPRLGFWVKNYVTL